MKNINKNVLPIAYIGMIYSSSFLLYYLFMIGDRFHISHLPVLIALILFAVWCGYNIYRGENDRLK